jgi:hypothetical protein
MEVTFQSKRLTIAEIWTLEELVENLWNNGYLVLQE